MQAGLSRARRTRSNISGFSGSDSSTDRPLFRGATSAIGTRLCGLVGGAALTFIGATANAYPIAKGSQEIRPLIGVLANMESQVQQFQMGVDYQYALTGPLGLVLGTWLGFGKDYIGMEFHVGVKYRFTRLHPRFAPFVAGGGGFHLGFVTKDVPDKKAFTALGFRFGGGIDFFPSQTIIPGMQIMFDLGPRFSPGVAFQGSAQITWGCSFLF